MQTKSILMALSAMALVTACTNDETIEMNRGEGISLSAVAGKATRAGSEATTTNSIDNFHVYAFTQGLEYMNHDVTRIDDNTWTYGDTKFLQSDGYEKRHSEYNGRGREKNRKIFGSR